jgi:hypothetical protein
MLTVRESKTGVVHNIGNTKKDTEVNPRTNTISYGQIWGRG